MNSKKKNFDKQFKANKVNRVNNKNKKITRHEFIKHPHSSNKRSSRFS